MDRFGSSESGAQGAVEDGATGPAVRHERRHVGARRRPPAPDSRARPAIGQAGPHGQDPTRLLQGPGQDGGHLPGGRRRRPVVGPRRPGLGRGRRHHHRARPGIGIHQLRRREDLPRRGRGGGQVPPRGVRRHRGRDRRRAVRPAGGGGRPAQARVHRALPSTSCRITAGPTSPATRSRGSSWWSTTSRSPRPASRTARRPRSSSDRPRRARRRRPAASAGGADRPTRGRRRRATVATTRSAAPVSAAPSISTVRWVAGIGPHPDHPGRHRS